MAKRIIRLIIEYDGTNYAGWQIQKDQPSIQQALNAAVFRVTGERVTVHGAGRTDAGVHALGQVGSFEIEHDLEAARFAPALNYYLPDDIRVQHSIQAADRFHARKSARWKRYRYLLSNRKSALYRHQRWELPDELDLSRLKEAAEIIVGEHDFAPFCVTASRKPDNRCTIYSAAWRQIGPLWVFEIRGNRFLHNMVRCLVGAMVNVATCTPDDNVLNLTLAGFRDIVETPTQQRVPFKAPAAGLYLVAVGYEEGITE